jgi:hypothetical protein
MPGHNNWFKINLELGLNNLELPFEMELSVPPTLTTDFKQASDEAAKLLASKFNKLYLCLSGGMDSEYVATVLMRNKIPFVPVLLKTKNNLGELWYAYHFCSKHNLKPLVLDYSTQNNKLLHILFKYSNAAANNTTISFFPHVVAEHIATLGGSLLTGYGDPFPWGNDYDMITNDRLETDEHAFYLDVNFGTQHPGGFFSYTPDLFFSLVTHLPLGINIQAAKEQLYQVPGRSKFVSDLEMPDFVPAKHRILKDPELQCLVYSRSDLLARVSTESTIKLSSI